MEKFVYVLLGLISLSGFFAALLPSVGAKTPAELSKKPVFSLAEREKTGLNRKFHFFWSK